MKILKNILVITTFCFSALVMSYNVIAAHTSSALGNTFQDEKLGYSIDYPSDWAAEKPSDYAATFSGKTGTPAYYVTVSIQNLASKAGRGKYWNVESVIGDFKNQLRSGSADAVIFEETEFTHQNGMKQLKGKQFKAEYTIKGQRVKQWLIVIPHSNLEIFYAWSYTAPAEIYDTFTPIAQTMLDSWTINNEEQ